MSRSVLVIANDPPYGSERSWNALRLAAALAKRDDTHVRIFLLGEAVGCALTGQKVPDGYYHLDRLLESAARHGADIGCCGTCLDARGLPDTALVKGAHRSTLDDLTDWTLDADQVLTF
jgi:uncharacterized protein involved in oxidation of intracellular sulfur